MVKFGVFDSKVAIKRSRRFRLFQLRFKRLSCLNSGRSKETRLLCEQSKLFEVFTYKMTVKIRIKAILRTFEKDSKIKNRFKLI